MSEGRLPVREGFSLWAPSYEHENPLTELDQVAVDRLLPAPARGALLDVGCGTGRRLPQPGPPCGPELVVGVDLVPAMLLSGGRRRCPGLHMVAANLESIPLRPGLFDVVWCRLTIGFLRDLELVFYSLANQLRPSGRVLVSDLHPELAAEGAERGFYDQNGAWRVIETVTHPASHIKATARRIGFEQIAQLELPAGAQQAETYRAAGRQELFEEHRRRPVLFAAAWRLTRGRQD